MDMSQCRTFVRIMLGVQRGSYVGRRPEFGLAADEAHGGRASLGGVVADAVVAVQFSSWPRDRLPLSSSSSGGRRRHDGGEDDLDSSYASNAEPSPGLADKPRRRWYARDDLGVAPFVVRTGVN